MTREQAIQIIAEKLGVDIIEATMILEKAEIGGEINNTVPIEKWLNERFLPNCIFIDEDGYARMCVDALKILSFTAATDYGSSRQRDMGQLWADMTRGYLGELAFITYLEHRWKINATLGHEVGALKDFLPEDIKSVKKENEPERSPKIKVSIKTVKWNGIWFDIPGDQFSHSDVQILVKVGAGRDHLFAFFKQISVFKDKVLKRGQDVGVLTQDSASKLFDQLPSFKPIPAYICGFVLRDVQYQNLSFSGKRGRKNYTITSWNGPIMSGDIEQIKLRENIAGSVKFEGIGEFAHDSGYLFNTGNLIWEENNWHELIDRI